MGENGSELSLNRTLQRTVAPALKTANRREYSVGLQGHPEALYLIPNRLGVTAVDVSRQE